MGKQLFSQVKNGGFSNVNNQRYSNKINGLRVIKNFFTEVKVVDSDKYGAELVVLV